MTLAGGVNQFRAFVSTYKRTRMPTCRTLRISLVPQREIILLIYSYSYGLFKTKPRLFYCMGSWMKWMCLDEHGDFLLNRRKQKRHPVVPCGMEQRNGKITSWLANWAVHIWLGFFFVISQQYSAILYMGLVRFLYVENALMAAFHNNKSKQ